MNPTLPLWSSWKTRLRRWHRDRALVSAIDALRAMHGRHPSRDLLARLAYGFGNEGWAAQLDLLDELARRVPAARAGILECGSGASTMLIAALTAETRTRFVSLEHHPEWHAKMHRLLEHFDLKHATLYKQALVPYDGFDWYELPTLERGVTFDLVFSDGPPGDTRGGRFGLIPCTRERFAPDCVIVADDTHRAEDEAVVDRWVAELPPLERTKREHFTVLELKPDSRARPPGT